MSNRLLALFVLVLAIAAIFSAYWYFFVANVGSVVVMVGDTKQVHITLTTEFKNTYTQDCTQSCLFERVPPVRYSLLAQSDGYDALSQDFSLSRGEKKVISLAFDKTVVAEAYIADKDEKIETIKLTKAIATDSQSGSVQALGVYVGQGYAMQKSPDFSIFSYDTNGKRLPVWSLSGSQTEMVSWNGFEGLVLLKNKEKYGILDLASGIYTNIPLSGKILYVKR